MDFDSKIIAIRSLTSLHHAENIEPKIFTVIWNLGKRCNYDCSYCSPAIHDWVSEHQPLQNIENFITQLEKHCQQSEKTFKISLTGGEPFVHPGIIEILKIIKQSARCGPIITVTTNGSLPIDLYLRGLEWVSHITVSLHLERPDGEIRENLEKIKRLNKVPGKWINVQLMCLPGRLDFIQQVIEPFFLEHNIKYTLRKIRPMPDLITDDHNQEIINSVKDKTRKDILKIKNSVEFNKEYKKTMKALLQDQLANIYEEKNFYSRDELEYLNKNQPRVFWENIGVWNQKGDYFNTNSDILASKSLNSFRGWNCFVGIDGIFIDFDGEVYRGACTNGGTIGNISRDITFPQKHIVCEKNWCVSNPDQTTRKSSPDYLHLITKSNQ